MRLGIVRGGVVLNVCESALRGVRLVIVDPVTDANLAANNGLGGGKPLIAVDQLGACSGQIVAVVEGREAANPYWPEKVPVDAYCALIVDSIDYRPPNESSADGVKQ